jgi:hypothetical protein
MAPCPDHPELPCGRRMHGEAPPQRRPFDRCTYEYRSTAERRGGRCKTLIYAEYLEALVWYEVHDIICLHSIVPHPADPMQMWVAISAVGTFYSADGGVTWTPRTKGVRAGFLPERYPETGQCVHKLGRDIDAVHGLAARLGGPQLNRGSRWINASHSCPRPAWGSRQTVALP